MTALLVIDRTLPIELASTFDAYRDWLRADGYEVDVVWADKTNSRNPKAHIALAENVVWPWVKAHTDGVVQFIGDLPMPYSGINSNPDGHTDTAGSYASPVYYVAESTEWTDVGDNSARPAKRERINCPGDGRFDQQSVNGVDAAVGWLNLSRLNARTFGSTLTGIDWIIHCYTRYFERNLAYRRGEWKPKTYTGQGASTGNGAGWFAALDNGQTFWGRDPLKAIAGAPYAVTLDFKSLDSSITKLPSPFTVLDLTYGSYQIDYLTARTTNPLYAAALAVGSMGPQWEVKADATLGELWKATIAKSRSTIPVLYGDCTLKISPPLNVGALSER